MKKTAEENFKINRTWFLFDDYIDNFRNELSKKRGNLKSPNTDEYFEPFDKIIILDRKTFNTTDKVYQTQQGFITDNYELLLMNTVKTQMQKGKKNYNYGKLYRYNNNDTERFNNNHKELLKISNNQISIINNSNTLKQLYQKLIVNNEQIKKRNTICNETRKIIIDFARNFSNYSDNETIKTLNEIFKSQDNGIAKVIYPSRHVDVNVIKSNKEYLQKCIDFINIPSVNNYNNVLQLRAITGTNGHIISNRFIAGATNKVSFVIDEGKFDQIFNKLIELGYIENYTSEGNWYTKNVFLMEQINQKLLPEYPAIENYHNIFVWELYSHFFGNNNENEEENTENQEMEATMHAKNTIFYGPPGTGKTHLTIARALEIIDGKTKNNHSDNMKRFNELKEAGNIEFITFHQSYSYEDFIEGIKPIIDDETNEGKIQYEVRKGIFKNIAKRANNVRNKDFEMAYSQLIKELNEKNSITLATPAYFKEFQLSYANGKTGRDGHLVVKLQSGKEFNYSKARIEGFYIDENFRYEGDDSYCIPIGNYMRKNFGNNKYENTPKSYVIIIDEINRGNISNIFGELITLIEDSKRLGEPGGIELTLPTSQEPFGVPNNLYIIGTMNTADRSLAQMDLALRRRFQFEPMYPNYEVWGDKNNPVRQFLEKLNNNIAILDSEEHTIGHAFFYNANGKIIDNLADIGDILCGKILPLLEEYFFDDPVQIQQVLDNELFNAVYEKIDNNTARTNITKYRKTKGWQDRVNDYFNKSA